MQFGDAEGEFQGECTRARSAFHARGVTVMHYEKLLFVHIPKTAGSTVTNYFTDVYAGREILRLRRQDGSLDVLSAEAAERAHYIWLHAALRMFPYDSKGFRRVTFLRDPVDRTQSFFFFIRNPDVIANEERSGSSPELIRSLREAGEMTFEEFVCSENPHHVARLESIYPMFLATHLHEDSRLQLEDTLESMDRYFDFVGLTQDLAGGLEYIRRFLISPNAPKYTGEWANRSARSEVTLSERAVRRLEELLALDTIVYREAAAAYAKLDLHHPPRTRSGPITYSYLLQKNASPLNRVSSWFGRITRAAA